MNGLSSSSTKSNQYSVRPEVLDDVYRKQLQTLRDLILKHNQTTNIDLCYKWFKAFDNTSEHEKMARNCLSALMQQQLNELGTLEEPFINVENCTRGLETVLLEFNDQSNATIKSSEETTETENLQNEEAEEESNGTKSNQTIFKNQHNCRDKLPGCQIDDQKVESILLRRELEMIRAQLTAKQVENIRLQETIQKLLQDNNEFVATLQNIKSIFLEAIDSTIQKLQKDDKNILSYCQIFQTVSKAVFVYSEDDAAFYAGIKTCDENLMTLINSQFEEEHNKRKELLEQSVSKKVEEAKVKQCKKYERRLRVQDWGYRLEIKLAKLKCFSALRSIFISAPKNGDENLWHMLKLLEDKYEALVNEI